MRPLKLISFNPLRAVNIPGVRCLKPEQWFAEKESVRAADWILYPEYWQVNALVYGLKKRIFPSIMSYHLGHDKVEMLRALEAVRPENMPFTRVAPSTDYWIERILEEFDFPVVFKDVRSSMGRGVFLVENERELRRLASERETLYVQEHLPIDRDLRVVFVGRSVVTAYWRIRAEGRFHNNISRGATVSFEDVPEQALRLVEETALELGIDHAGFDVAMVGDHPCFIEFNVLFGGEGLRIKGIKLGPLVLKYLMDQDSRPRHPEFPHFSKTA